MFNQTTIMQQRIRFWLILLLGIFTSTHPLLGQVQKLFLNPKVAGGENQSKFVDSIRFIPLEAAPGARFEIYSNIEITENNMFVTDFPNKQILFYSFDGRFIKKVSYKKLGGWLYPNYQKETNQLVFWGLNKNYQLTPTDKIKIELDANNPKNLKYYKKYIIDLGDSNFAIQKAPPTNYEIMGAYRYYDDFYFISKTTASTLYKDSVAFELNIYKDHKLVKSFFPYNRIKEPRFLYYEGSVAMNVTDTPYVRYVTRPFCDTIYKLVRDSMTPVYKLVFPLENALPTSFYTTPFKNKTERQNFDRNNGWLLRQIFNFIETPRFLFFFVSYLSNYESYVYDKGSSVFYKGSKIKGDSTQFNLQLFAGFNLNRRNHKYYVLKKPEEVQAFFKTNKTVPVPKELEHYIQIDAQKLNPILIEFQLKN